MLISFLEEISMEEKATVDKYKNKIITIPNLMSMLRIFMIPLIAWLYLGPKNYLWAAILIVISGITDVLDGMIARKFNMKSEVGKVLDPFADKATQLAMILLLITRFPLLIMPFIVSVIKETFMAVTGYMVIKKRGIVMGADWHGKAATVVVIATIFLHFLWFNITPIVSNITAILCTIMITLSLILYAIRNFGYLMGKEGKKQY